MVGKVSNVPAAVLLVKCLILLAKQIDVRSYASEYVTTLDVNKLLPVESFLCVQLPMYYIWNVLE